MINRSEIEMVRPSSPSSSWTVPGRMPNPLASLRLHRKFALLVMAVVLTIGLPLAFYFGRHQYVAEAKLEISPTFPSAVLEHSSTFNSDEEYRGFVQQQVAEIGSYETALAALRKLGNQRDLWQRSDETERIAAERLVKFVDVSPVANTYLISVSLAGDRPDGLAQIVNAVVSAYLSRQHEWELDQSRERVQLLALHKAELEKESDSLRLQESQLAQELGVSTFGQDFVNPYEKMLEDATAALDTARRGSIEARAHLAALNQDELRVKSLEVDSTAEQMMATNPQSNEARAQLTKQREAVFLELQDLGPNHPGRSALEQQMRNIDDELARMKDDEIGKVKVILVKNHQTKAQQEISSAQAQVDQAELAEKGIGQQVEDLKASAAAFGSKFKEAVTIDIKLTGDSAQIRQIDEQIGVLQTETQSPGFVSLASAAMTPDMSVRGKRRVILFVFGIASLFLAVVIPTILDLVDPLIKSPAELEAILGFPAFGAVLGNEGHVANEALRRLALGILRECRASGTSSFVLTPVSDGTNGYRLTSELVQQIKALGLRALAIESKDLASRSPASAAGIRQSSIEQGINRVTRPLVRPSTGIGHGALRSTPPAWRTSGLTSASAAGNLASVSVNELMQTSPAMAPKAVRIAGEPTDRLPLAENREMEELDLTRRELELLPVPEPLRSFREGTRDAYDIILFDAPPILSSADAEMLIQMPAGAILIVRSGHDVPRDVAAAVRRLERLSPPVVGTVIAYEPRAKDNDDCSPRAIIRRLLAAR